MTCCPYGFRIVGGTWEARRLVDASAALAGYAACDERAEVHREAYLSAFQFGEDFRRLLLETGSTAGFSGLCWSPWLWWDLDSDELQYACKDAGALALFLVERYAVEPEYLLIFFSGSKGFHIGLPTAFWSPAPSDVFHRVARRFAENVAELASVTIDTGVYDKVRAFRAPNSRHSKAGLHKRRLTLDQLTGSSLERIVELAAEPAPFDLPAPIGTSDQAVVDWQAAVTLVDQESEAKAARRATCNGTPTLTRSTLAFIREGAEEATGTGFCIPRPQILPSSTAPRHWLSRYWKSLRLTRAYRRKTFAGKSSAGCSLSPDWRARTRQNHRKAARTGRQSKSCPNAIQTILRALNGTRVSR